MKEVSEVRYDYIDEEDNLLHIDVWFTDDDNEEGKTVAVIDNDTDKVIYFDNLYRTNEKVQAVIKEILSERDGSYECNLIQCENPEDNNFQDYYFDDGRPVPHGTDVGVEITIKHDTKFYLLDGINLPG
jgi:hypothetical protein